MCVYIYAIYKYPFSGRTWHETQRVTVNVSAPFAFLGLSHRSFS